MKCVRGTRTDIDALLADVDCLLDDEDIANWMI